MRSRYCGPLIVAFFTGVAAPASAQLRLSPHLDASVAGDVETSRGGAGAALGYYLPAWRGLGGGLELDATWHGHFFRDEDVAHLVPAGVDLNTDALLLMGQLVLPVSIPRAPIWRPYGTVGLGVIHALFTVPGTKEYDIEQNNLTFSAGFGMMHQLTQLLGLRADVRYYHAFVDEHASHGGYFEDYSFWAVAVGVTFQLPAQRWPDLW
jgi:opacity protein-like surface antigen